MSLADDEQKNAERRRVLQAVRREVELERAFAAFSAAGFNPILIKGWAAARLYPNPFDRRYLDFDFCVEPADYSRARVWAAKNPFPIDLHNGLRDLDALPFDDLFANSELVTVRCGKVRVLRLEDHLRVLCVHWLIDGGAEFEKLWDIYHAIANRPADFDWDRFLNAAGARRRNWFVCVVALAHLHLGLKLDDTPLADEIKDPNLIPRWLTAALENEWREKIKLRDLADSLGDWRTFRQQLGKRFPPNPIAASVMSNAPFDDTPRFPYQLRNFIMRLFARLDKNIPAVVNRFFIPSQKSKTD